MHVANHIYQIVQHVLLLLLLMSLELHNLFIVEACEIVFLPEISIPLTNRVVSWFSLYCE